MSLRAQILRGGSFLALRQGLGMIIGVAGVVTLTRVIGPANYGRYAAAVGLFAYLQSFTTWGLNVFLIRKSDDESGTASHQAFTLLGLSGLLTALLVLSSLDRIERWAHLSGLREGARWMALMIPLVLTSQVALAALERNLRYRTVAAIELGGQLTYYAAALPLALSGRHSLAPFAGWAAQQAVMSSAQFACAAYRPRLVWDRDAIRQMWHYGLSYSASIWVWQLRTLVNPLVVGRFAGLETVGIVALTIRLVEYLSFVKTAAWRLSIAALARMQGDIPRIRKAIGTGMTLQMLALGPFLLAFSWLAPWVMPKVLGNDWTPVLRLFPYVAISYLANAVFNLHSSALYALQRNWDVTVFHVLHILLFLLTAVVLIPPFGILGYGGAELVALGSYVAISRSVREHIGRVAQTGPLLWAGAFSLALFHDWLGVASLGGLLLVITVPRLRRHVSSVVRHTVEAYRGT